jgi:hypothetical protein
MTMGNSRTFSPYSLNISCCDNDLFMKMNDSSQSTSFAEWRVRWKKSCLWQIPTRISLLLASVNTKKFRSSFSVVQEITLIAGNCRFQVNKAVIYVTTYFTTTFHSSAYNVNGEAYMISVSIGILIQSNMCSTAFTSPVS